MSFGLEQATFHRIERSFRRWPPAAGWAVLAVALTASGVYLDLEEGWSGWTPYLGAAVVPTLWFTAFIASKVSWWLHVHDSDRPPF